MFKRIFLLLTLVVLITACQLPPATATSPPLTPTSEQPSPTFNPEPTNSPAPTDSGGIDQDGLCGAGAATEIEGLLV